MNSKMTRHWFAGFALAGALAFVAACSGSPSSSVSPTGPTGLAAAAAVSSATSSPTSDVPEPDPCATIGTTSDTPTEPCEPPPCETVSGTTSDTPPEPCEPPPPPPPPPGDEGCTPGYWKNHTDSWPPTGYSPAQTVGSVFTGAAPYAGNTLLQALAGGGGSGVNGAKLILLRAAVAALLNAAHPDVNYTQSAASVIASVNAALASGNRDTMLTLAGSLDRDNNLGCPLN